MNKNKRVGEVYGDLKIIENLGNGKYKCRCACGTVKAFFLSNMKKGKSTSCGCSRSLKVSRKNRTHGDRYTRLYSIWTNMKSRCENRKSSSFKYYGGKGISVDPKWNDYVKFKVWAMENGYAEHLTLDRIDNRKDYSPENCRWANYKEQSRNRDFAWHVTIDGVTKHAKDWCEENGINYKTAHTRKLRGWSDKNAVTLKSDTELAINKIRSLSANYCDAGADMEINHWLDLLEGK